MNNLPKLSFVILHYVNEQDTIDCVNSIISNINYQNKDIIIVDNASPNQSGIALEQKYEDCPFVTVILNEQNLGFAKGNNVGYQYAKYKGEADFIILINNDTLIKQSNFCDQIIRLFSQTGYAVLGPKIISLIDGLNQNPVPYSLVSTYRILRRLCMLILMYCANLFHMDQHISKDPRKYHTEVSSQGNYQLFGCCLIFSSIFIQQFDGLYPGTFMYGEEDILKFICESNKLKMLYNDDIEIFHKEGSSTKSLQEKSIKSRQFYYRNAIYSLFQLLLLKKHIKGMKEKRCNL